MSTKKTVTVAILWIGAAQGMAGQNVPALKDVFKDTFLIGGALNRPLVTGKDPNAAALAAKHFSTAMSENDLKWLLVHPRPNQYNWEPADSYVAFCEKNKMFIIGHCLVWHGQTPRWVFQDEAGNPLTRDALLARMKDHIMTGVGRCKGRIEGWDVVNEALEDNGTMRNTQWLRIIGEGSPDKQYDCIENAFRWAHEADPNAAVKGGEKTRRVAGRTKTAAPPASFCENAWLFMAREAVKIMRISAERKGSVLQHGTVVRHSSESAPRGGR